MWNAIIERKRLSACLRQNKLLSWKWAGSPWNRWVTERGTANRRLHSEMIYNSGSASKQWHCSVCFFLTRDFVFQFHVGHLAPGRHTHASRPVRSIQLPICSPGTQTHRRSGRPCDVGGALTEVYGYWCRNSGGEEARQTGDLCFMCMCLWVCVIVMTCPTLTHTV